MKKITLLLCLVAYVATAQVQNYNVGDVVDDFTVTDVQGVEHNLYDYAAQGKYVWLDFFFDTCVPCQTTTPIFNEFYDKYHCGNGDVICISVNNGSDGDQEVIDFENTYGGPFTHAPAISADGGAGAVDSNFGITAYPTYCLIGPDNKLVVSDIWPLSGVETFEATFPTGFSPPIDWCTLLGANEVGMSLDFILYPTVSNGKVTISLNEPIETEINIYSVSGKLVFSSNYNSLDIQLDLNVSTGTYFVSIASEIGSVTKTIIIK